jgi:hypothetical protein
LILPDSITMIDISAFQRCRCVNGSLRLPSHISVIRNHSFAETAFAGDLLIPDSVVAVENYSFCMSRFTGKINLSQNLVSIGFNAFSFISGFDDDLIVPNSVQSILNAAFQQTHIRRLTLSRSLVSLGNGAFNGTVLSGVLQIPPLLTQIPLYGFSNCPGLSGALFIHSNISIVNAYAFQSSGIESLVISGADRVLPYAFANCRSLFSIVVNCTSILRQAFSLCVNLSEVDLTVDNVTTLSFESITTIANLTLRAATKFEANSFRGTHVLRVLYYPTDFLDLPFPLFEAKPLFIFVNGYRFDSFLGFDLDLAPTEIQLYQIIAISISCLFFVLIVVCVICQIRSSAQKKEMAEQKLLHLAIVDAQPSPYDEIPGVFVDDMN